MIGDVLKIHLGLSDAKCPTSSWGQDRKCTFLCLWEENI